MGGGYGDFFPGSTWSFTPEYNLAIEHWGSLGRVGRIHPGSRASCRRWPGLATAGTARICKKLFLDTGIDLIFARYTVIYVSGYY